MTVEQLIKNLQHYDPKLPVFLSGYEGGVHQAGSLCKVEVALNVNDAWYYGPHEILFDGYDDLYSNHQRMEGVYLT